MRFVLGIIGIGFSYLLVRYREQIGSALGEPEWATKVGGIFNVVILLGVVLFFLSIAYMVGTFDVLFPPPRGLDQI